MCLLNYFRSLFGLRLMPSCKGQCRERRSPLHVWEDALNIPHGYWPLALHIRARSIETQGGSGLSITNSGQHNLRFNDARLAIRYRL